MRWLRLRLDISMLRMQAVQYTSTPPCVTDSDSDTHHHHLFMIHDLMNSLLTLFPDMAVWGFGASVSVFIHSFSVPLVPA